MFYKGLCKIDEGMVRDMNENRQEIILQVLSRGIDLLEGFNKIDEEIVTEIMEMKKLWSIWGNIVICYCISPANKRLIETNLAQLVNMSCFMLHVTSELVDLRAADAALSML
ncbi:hypothetical protein EVAR_88107_1 [Eumeta japonica]|uniref:Uncharacterized protein n=1 Tax=Eumeta variegata TaxID=151549 RepID=A0A4C2A6Y4_EUMVA|nr:hypothetical protein EVAR_88107_1 [Eumeta japonica]